VLRFLVRIPGVIAGPLQLAAPRLEMWGGIESTTRRSPRAKQKREKNLLI
jgi:hypothetical protein